MKFIPTYYKKKFYIKWILFIVVCLKIASKS